MAQVQNYYKQFIFFLFRVYKYFFFIGNGKNIFLLPGKYMPGILKLLGEEEETV